MFAQPLNDEPSREFEDAWFSVMECGVAENCYPTSEFFHQNPMKIRMAETFGNLMRLISAKNKEYAELDLAYDNLKRYYDEKFDELQKAQLEITRLTVALSIRDECIKAQTHNAEVTRPGGFSPGPVSEANEG